MAIGNPPLNPWMWEAGDYQERIIRITIPWDPATRALQDATVFRDPACLYTRIYIGVGPDGAPESSPNAYPVPAGTSTVRANTLRQNGLSTIDDLLVLQVTAGP